MTRRVSVAGGASSVLLVSTLLASSIALAMGAGQPLDGGIDGEGAIDVFVRLDMPSVSELNIQHRRGTGAMAPAAAQRGHARRIDAQQASVRPLLEAAGAEVMSSTRVGVNGFRVRVDPARMEDLRQVDGVISVTPVELHYPENALSVPGIDAPQAWDQVGTGEGVTIAVIDSGIDYLHANFGGSGDPADFAANDRVTLDGGGFPNDKVIGGWDFVGDAYNAGNPATAVPQPNPNPLDCATGNAGGHGTHVAGSAAGLGVSGTIGPGVAPGASLYALRVFGCSGSTAVTVDAIEWAMDPDGDGDMSDHAHVINMSLGAARGSPLDASAIASAHASELGIIVVAAAGNAGAQPYVVGSPSVSPPAISVAASSKTLSFAINVSEPASVAGLYESVEAAFSAPLFGTGNVSGNLVAPADPANFEGCNAWTNDATDQIALVFRGACPFQQKFDQAVAAGAKAVVVGNNVAGAPIVMGGTASPIPGVMITMDAGQALSAALDSDAVVAELSPGDYVVVSDFGNQIAGFSSRGPGDGGGQFKPEITGPGVAIISAGVGTGTGTRNSSGTSMATPHLAGLAALMRQAFPGHGVDAIKSMIMNSATDLNTGGAILPLSRQGTGVANAANAVGLGSYASPAGVSFGRINKAVRRIHVRERVTVTDFSGMQRNFSGWHVPNQSFPGIDVTCPGSVKVQGNRSRSFNIDLHLDTEVAEANGVFDNASASHREVDGWCMLSDGTDTLRVGYLAIIDPASRQVVEPVSGGAKVLNVGPSSGWAEAFTHLASGDENASGTLAAIAHTGFRTGVIGGIPVLEFAIATQAPWELPSQSQINVYLDVNGDGVDDVRLIAGDWATLQAGGTPGVLVSGQFNLAVGGSALDFIVGGVDYNDHTMFLPFRLDRGWIPSSFDYRVEFVPRHGPVGIQHGSVDFANEIVTTDNGFLVAPGQSVQVGASAPGTLLWLFQNNEAGTQAHTVVVE